MLPAVLPGPEAWRVEAGRVLEIHTTPPRPPPPALALPRVSSTGSVQSTGSGALPQPSCLGGPLCTPTHVSLRTALPIPARPVPSHVPPTLSTPLWLLQRGFAQAYMPDYDLFKLVSLLYEVVPDILTQTGKVRSRGGITSRRTCSGRHMGGERA